MLRPPLPNVANVLLKLIAGWPFVPAEHDVSDDVRALGLFVHAIRFERADVLHSHGYKTNILLGFLPRRIRTQPLLCTMHGYTHAGVFDRMRLYRWLDLRAVRRSDATVLVHRGMLSNAGVRSLASRSVRVIENGLASHQDAVSGAIDPAVRQGIQQTSLQVERSLGGFPAVHGRR